MLRDKDGNIVLLKSKSCGWRQEYSFCSIIDGKIKDVDEAIVGGGKVFGLPSDIINKKAKLAGFGNESWTRKKLENYSNVIYSHGRDTFGFSNSEAVYLLDGKSVCKSQYDEFAKFFYDVCKYEGLTESNKGMKFKAILQMIGEGKTVTISSLMENRSVDELKPRLNPGDTVKCIRKGVERIGFVVSTRDRVNVEFEGGERKTWKYSEVFNTNVTIETDPVDRTISENFKFALDGAKKRLYKSEYSVERFVYPLFPKEGRESREIDEAKTCLCPLCGWKLGMLDGEHVLCNCCGITGSVIRTDNDTMTVLLNPAPKKNTFQVKEARCCDNCGLFTFDSGRQGKRNTGYCKVNNCCVYAFSTCDAWYPRNVSRYDNYIKQHLINLKYGIDDVRNTQRPEIDDVVFTEEDFLKEKSRGEKSKLSYLVAWKSFEDELLAESEKLIVRGKMSDKQLEILKENLKI